MKGNLKLSIWAQISCLNLTCFLTFVVSIIFLTAACYPRRDFYPPPPKKGNQTFVLHETNFVLHKKQNKWNRCVQAGAGGRAQHFPEFVAFLEKQEKDITKFSLLHFLTIWHI
jgi:hypothetical protein